MPRRLPPLNSLRAFEAAARSGSFVRAAAELHVTPGAVSHHVRQLESVLGIALFERRARGVGLTRAGERYRQQVAAALRALEDATAALHRADLEGPLRLSLPQSTAQWWLAPRLPGLLAAFPSLQLQVAGDPRLVDLRRGEADLALRFGGGDYPGLTSWLVMGDALSVLAPPHPAHPPRAQRLRGRAFEPACLLEDLGASPSEAWLHWPPWLRQLGIARRPTVPRVGFSDSGLALSACLAGTGWCIGRLSLALESVRRGRLLAQAAWQPTEFAHHLLCRPEEADAPRILAFRDWLHREAAQFAESAQAVTGVRLRVGD